MAGIKEIRNRIVSVTNTQKITSAMKMVSAAKLRKAQTRVIQMRPYSSKLHEIVGNLSSSVNPEDNPFLEKREIKKVLIVVISANSGLCGAFNSNIAKSAISLAKAKYKELLATNSVDFIAIGKKGGEQLKVKGYEPLAILFEIFNDLDFEKSNIVAESITEGFLTKEYDAVDIVYNKFINAASQEIITQRLLPICQESIVEEVKHSSHNYNADFIFEPSKIEIVNEIIPKTIKTLVYQALIESFASEQGARMTAMHQATDNAGTLLRALKIQYNKARQTSITNEILEIVSGATALNG
jgi:F-type H+-transporting ATPase subunit gamma